jgi:undecaprenyl-diphosphatase
VNDIGERFDRKLVAPLVLAVAGACLLAGLTQNVIEHDGVASADPRILHDVIAHRGPVLTPFAKAVTTLGTSPVAYTVVVLAAVLAARTNRRWWPFVLAAGAVLSGQVVRLLFNHAVGRPRPPHELWLMHAGGYAFPSGHTTTATLGYVVAAALLGRRWPDHRIAFFCAAGLCALAVGVSRVYLGVHWPTDVLGGWLLASTWLALCGLAYRTVLMVTGRSDR